MAVTTKSAMAAANVLLWAALLETMASETPYTRQSASPVMLASAMPSKMNLLPGALRNLRGSPMTGGRVSPSTK